MKKLFLAVITSFLFANVGFSNTYVWEDYDDFSGSSLDTSKWDVGYFSGGEVASTNGGVATLSGSEYTGSDLENVPPIWQTATAQSNGQSNSGIFVKETDIYGIEVEVSIPSSGNSQNVGFIVETHPSDGSTYNGIELAWRENGLYWSYENENPSNAQILDLSQEADFDTSYTLSVIHTGSRMELHINGTRVANLNSNFTPNHWLIGSFNDDGLPYATIADNVRVLRKKSYPQGWMWTEFYPWAYSHETGGWLYFELAKDSDGNPVMNYYDHNSGSWDLYGPSLNKFTDR